MTEENFLMSAQYLTLGDETMPKHVCTPLPRAAMGVCGTLALSVLWVVSILAHVSDPL